MTVHGKHYEDIAELMSVLVDTHPDVFRSIDNNAHTVDTITGIKELIARQNQSMVSRPRSRLGSRPYMNGGAVQLEGVPSTANSIAQVQARARTREMTRGADRAAVRARSPARRAESSPVRRSGKMTQGADRAAARARSPTGRAESMLISRLREQYGDVPRAEAPVCRRERVGARAAFFR